MPENINICFSFEAAVALCSEGWGGVGGAVVNEAFRQEIIETKYV